MVRDGSGITFAVHCFVIEADDFKVTTIYNAWCGIINARIAFPRTIRGCFDIW